jgi:hypothetical protein
VANTLAYRLAKLLPINLEVNNPLPHTFNVKNAIQLMKDLLEIPFDKDLKFVSLFIKNMYLNVPVKELIKINEPMCNQNELNKELRCKSH